VSLRTEQRLAAGAARSPDPELHQAHKPSPDPELTFTGRINSVLIFLPHLVAAVVFHSLTVGHSQRTGAGRR